MAKIAGIYKISSPSGNVYIGQSFDLELRFNLYSRLKCKRQRALYSSLNKYGYAAHSISIIHFLPSDVNQLVIDAYETLYIQLYKDCGIKLLNLKDGGSHGKHCEETKKLISHKITGRVLSADHIKKISENFTGSKHPFYGKKAAQSHKDNISNSLKGKRKSEDHKRKLSAGLKGKYLGVKKPAGHGRNVSLALKGRVFTEDWKRNIGKTSIGRNIKSIIQMSRDGDIIKEWDSIVIAASQLGIKSSNIVNCAKGRDKSYKGYIWKYK